jgi:hypothetical protein
VYMERGCSTQPRLFIFFPEAMAPSTSLSIGGMVTRLESWGPQTLVGRTRRIMLNPPYDDGTIGPVVGFTTP